MKTRTQSGFTLVEIAIVLVIVGLLLGGVLKGQEMIEGAKVKAAMNDVKGVAAAYNTYVDKYRRQPGDDGPIATITARGGQFAVNTVAGNANGDLLIANANTFNYANGEPRAFWQQLRGAGLLTGDASAVTQATGQPLNPWGGFMGVTTEVAVAGNIAANPGLKICLSAVPGKAAREMDTKFDDGVATTGTIRAGIGATPAVATAAYVDASFYVVCSSLQ